MVRKRAAREAWLEVDTLEDGTERLWVMSFLRDGWISALRVEEQGGRPVVAELRIFYPQGQELPPGGLTARVRADVRTDSLLRQTLGDVLAMQTRAGKRVGEYLPEDVSRASPRLGATTARRWTDLELARLAADYLRLCRETRAPVQALAEQWGLNPGHARQLLFRAGDRFLLEGRVPGKAGGSLGERAKDLLAAERKREGQ